MGKGQLKASLYLDLRKAFDIVMHGRLLSKLELYEIKVRKYYGFKAIYLVDIKDLPSSILQQTVCYVWCSTRLNIGTSAICYLRQ